MPIEFSVCVILIPTPGIDSRDSDCFFMSLCSFFDTSWEILAAGTAFCTSLLERFVRRSFFFYRILILCVRAYFLLMWPYYGSICRPYLLKINFVFQLSKYPEIKERTAIIYPDLPIGKCYLQFIVISCLYCFYSWIHRLPQWINFKRLLSANC